MVPALIPRSTAVNWYIGNKNRKSKGGKPRSLHNGKRVGRSTTTVVSGPVTNVGDRAVTKLRYVAYGAISTASLGYGENIFRLNSLFDPDYSGAGAQPLGFDQWSAFYQRYKVLSAKCKCQFAAPTSLAESIVSITPNLVNTIDNSGPNILAEPYSKNSIFSTNGGWKPVLEADYNIAKIFGLTKEEYGEESYTAATSGSPVNVAYLHVRVDTASGGLSGSVYYLLEVEFHVEFYQRVELELSLWGEFVQFRKDKEKKTLEVPPVSSQNPPVKVPTNDEKDVKELLSRLLNK